MEGCLSKLFKNIVLLCGLCSNHYFTINGSGKNKTIAAILRSLQPLQSIINSRKGANNI